MTKTGAGRGCAKQSASDTSASFYLNPQLFTTFCMKMDKNLSPDSPLGVLPQNPRLGSRSARSPWSALATPATCKFWIRRSLSFTVKDKLLPASMTSGGCGCGSPV